MPHKKPTELPVLPNSGALSIPQFCLRFGISRDLYKTMRKEGWGPKLMAVGGRTLISYQAIEDWCRDRERAYPEDMRRNPHREEPAP